MVEAVAVVVETGFGIVVLRGEAVAEEVGERTGLGDRAAEVVVLVRGGDVAGFVYVLRDIAVVVVCGEVELTVARDGKETTDTSRALERVGEVQSPEVLDFCDVGCSAINGGDCFVN